MTDTAAFIRKVLLSPHDYTTTQVLAIHTLYCIYIINTAGFSVPTSEKKACLLER